MACADYVIKGLARGCKDSMGGITKVWVSTSTFLGTDADVSLGTNGDISTMGMNASTYKVFEFFKNTGSMTTTANISDTAGTSFSTELSLQFMKMDTAKRIELMGLLMDECVAVVKDSNGKYWFLGFDEPVQASAATGVTGTTATDLSGYTITLKDDARELPREITDSTFTGKLETITIA